MSFKPAPWPRKLRSQEWYGGTSRDATCHRGWMKNQGHPHDLFDGRPVIGILPVAPTPLNPDGSLDTAGMCRVLDCKIDQGVDAICILANHSEQFLLSDDQRATLMRLSLEHVAGRVPVIVTISHFSTGIAVARPRGAADGGGDGDDDAALSRGGAGAGRGRDHRAFPRRVQGDQPSDHGAGRAAFGRLAAGAALDPAGAGLRERAVLQDRNPLCRRQAGRADRPGV